MSKLIKILFGVLLLLLISFSFFIDYIQAQEPPLIPDLEIKIGGWGTEQQFETGYKKLTCPPGIPGGEGKPCLEISWISDYIGAVFKYGVGLAAVLAVVMIMVGGFLWLISGGSPDRVGKAKEFISSALLGLFLALFSYTLLYTINPRLVALEPLRVVVPPKYATKCCEQNDGTFKFEVIGENDKCSNGSEPVANTKCEPPLTPDILTKSPYATDSYDTYDKDTHPSCKTPDGCKSCISFVVYGDPAKPTYTTISCIWKNGYCLPKLDTKQFEKLISARPCRP